MACFGELVVLEILKHDRIWGIICMINVPAPNSRGLLFRRPRATYAYRNNNGLTYRAVSESVTLRTGGVRKRIIPIRCQSLANPTNHLGDRSFAVAGPRVQQFAGWSATDDRP